jgi:hypothetical protein
MNLHFLCQSLERVLEITETLSFLLWVLTAVIWSHILSQLIMKPSSLNRSFYFSFYFTDTHKPVAGEDV